MIIVVAWALLIWLVVLLAFGPDMFKMMSGRRAAARDEGGSKGADRSSTPTGGAAQDFVGR